MADTKMHRSLLLAVLAILLPVLCTSEDTAFNLEHFKNGLSEYLTTGIKPTNFLEDDEEVAFPFLFRRHSRDDNDVVNELVCVICTAVADALIVARRGGLSKEVIQGVVEELCIDLDVESKTVCHGVIDLNIDIFLYIIDNKLDLLGSRVCSIILQSYGCQNLSNDDWAIDIPQGYSRERTNNVSSESPVQILHLSDFHYDPLYTPGGNALCGDPLCCQADQTAPETESAACGYWGDYRSADSPLHTIENSLQQAAAQHRNAEFVYYTGDIISHRVWDTSVEGNQRALKLIYELLYQYFPNATVLPVLGNHEPHPLNVWTPENITDPNLSTQWVFDLVAEQWSRWLPNDTQVTIEKGGYYTALLKPGFRVVGLNTNVCYTSNWYLIYDDVDPFGQLKWLVEVLTEAEQNGESVHVLSHLSSSDGSCWKTWSQQYRRIIDRFANTVTAHFSGHTHTDIFSLYFNSSQPSQAVNVVFNGASIVTFTSNNPSYKVYYADNQNFEILDFDEWVFNLTQANLTPDLTPDWFKLYSFKEAYGVDSLRPADLNLLAERFATNKTLLEQYFRFKVREADAALESGCSDSCHRSNLCKIVTSAFGDNVRCNALLDVYNRTNDNLY